MRSCFSTKDTDVCGKKFGQNKTGRGEGPLFPGDIGMAALDWKLRFKLFFREAGFTLCKLYIDIFFKDLVIYSHGHGCNLDWVGGVNLVPSGHVTELFLQHFTNHNINMDNIMSYENHMIFSHRLTWNKNINQWFPPDSNNDFMGPLRHHIVHIYVQVDFSRNTRWSSRGVLT